MNFVLAICKTNHNNYADFIAVLECTVDVVLVLDESTSVGLSNFTLMKSFVSDLVGRLDIDSGNTRVGLFTYSSSVDTAEAFNLNQYSTVDGVQSGVALLNYSTGRTNTAGALEYARTTMLISAAGDRPDVPNVVVVMTDGKPNVNASRTLVSTVRTLIKILPYFMNYLV